MWRYVRLYSNYAKWVTFYLKKVTWNILFMLRYILEAYCWVWYTTLHNGLAGGGSHMFEDGKLDSVLFSLPFLFFIRLSFTLNVGDEYEQEYACLSIVPWIFLCRTLWCILLSGCLHEKNFFYGLSSLSFGDINTCPLFTDRQHDNHIKNVCGYVCPLKLQIQFCTACKNICVHNKAQLVRQKGRKDNVTFFSQQTKWKNEFFHYHYNKKKCNNKNMLLVLLPGRMTWWYNIFLEKKMNAGPGSSLQPMA